jgi:hypothetical protein
MSALWDHPDLCVRYQRAAREAAEEELAAHHKAEAGNLKLVEDSMRRALEIEAGNREAAEGLVVELVGALEAARVAFEGGGIGERWPSAGRKILAALAAHAKWREGRGEE